MKANKLAGLRAAQDTTGDKFRQKQPPMNTNEHFLGSVRVIRVHLWLRLPET